MCQFFRAFNRIIFLSLSLTLIIPLSAKAAQNEAALLSRGYQLLVEDCCYNYTGCNLNQTYIVAGQTFICGEVAPNYGYTNLKIFQGANQTYICSEDALCYIGKLYPSLPGNIYPRMPIQTPTVETNPYLYEYDVAPTNPFIYEYFTPFSYQSHNGYYGHHEFHHFHDHEYGNETEEHHHDH